MSHPLIIDFLRAHGLSPDMAPAVHDLVRRFTSEGSLPTIQSVLYDETFSDDYLPVDLPSELPTQILGDHDPVEVSTSRAPTKPIGSIGRYEDLGLLGIGGMGEVRRVREGRYDLADARVIMRLRHVALAALVFILCSFMVQIWLLTKPGYAQIYRGLWSF